MAKRTKTIASFEGYFLPQITFTGKVFSGKSEGKKFIALPWVNRQIEQKLGYTPFAGTLNICLTTESMTQKKLLEKAQRLQIIPEKGYCDGVLIRASIGVLKCAIILPEVPSYPEDILEVIAPWNLRERLKLADGSQVAVIVDV
jgi:riboflavin kinase